MQIVGFPMRRLICHDTHMYTVNCFIFPAHGTYIGHIRLEPKKPQQVPLDSEIHFGASTRIYIIRERPQPMAQGDDGDKQGEKEGSLLGLPATETELDVSLQLRCQIC